MRGEEKLNFDKLYEAYVDDMFAYGIAFGVEKETVLDAIHDVFLHIYERQHEVSIQGNIKFYLLCCLKNRLISILRKTVNFENIEEVETETHNFSIKVSGLELIEEEERNQLTSRIEEILNELTDRQREVIYLRFMQELSYEEIANLLHITPKAARKLTYRALDRIREHYGSTDNELILLLCYLSVYMKYIA